MDQNNIHSSSPPAITGQRKRIAILVPDGVGVRNYLFSDTLKYLGQHEVLLLHQLPAQVVDTIHSLHPGTFTAVSLPRLFESRSNDLLRKLCMFARLHRNTAIAKNDSIKNNWLFFALLKGKKKIFFRMLDDVAAFVGARPSMLAKIDNRLFNRMMQSDAGNAAKAMLEELKPDLIISTHQRSVEAGYVMTAANQLGIKTIAVIFSWDNLPKSRINFKADYYFVWSKFMQWEMQRYYPEIAAEKVIVTGTPQFDNYYTKKGVWPFEKFNAFFGIEKDRPAICFSGNEPSFPSDHLYLRDVLEELDKSAMPVKPVVIVRPSPNDYTGRLEAEAHKFPHLAVVGRPLWNRIGNRDWESNYPTPEDGEVLLNLVYHCKAVINFGSTMGLDFAHFNKPALYINYNHPKCDWFDLIYGYQQEHFKTMDGLDAVKFIDSRELFVPAIEASIHHPDSIATQRLHWKERITDNLQNAGHKVAETLCQLAT